MKPERHAKAPNIRLIFSFTSHDPAGDERLLSVLDEVKPHVYVPETASFTKGEAEELERSMNQEIGRLKALPAARRMDALGAIRVAIKANRRLLHPYAPLIHGVRILTFERHTPQRATIIDRWYGDALRKSRDAEELFLKGQFKQAIDAYREGSQLVVKHDLERETQIREGAIGIRRELLKRFPDLNSEKEIRVLVRLGWSHAPIYAQLKKTKPPGITLERHLDMQPGLFSEADNRFRPNRKSITTPNRATLGRAIVRGIIDSQLYRLGVAPDDFMKRNAVAQLLAKRIKARHLPELSNAASTGTTGKKHLEAFLDKVEEHSGQRIPHTEKEADAFLSKHLGARWRMQERAKFE